MSDSTSNDNNNIQFKISDFIPSEVGYSEEGPPVSLDKIQVLRIIKGQEEISSLYSYELLVYLPDSLQIADLFIGARITLQVKQNNTVFQTICGCIMSVNACRYTDNNITKTRIFYKWVIRPEFAKACYSLNRQSWISGTSKISGTSTNVTLGEQVLQALAERWSTKLEFTTQAQKALPENLLQLRQNDESDYNFFARLLSTWGLGYIWRMKEDDTKKTYHEKIIIFDASKEDSDSKLKSVDSGAIMSYQKVKGMTLWGKNYGINKEASSEPALQNYCDPPSSDLINSLHDETWDQFSKIDLTEYKDRVVARYKSTHDNSFSCHGIFTLKNSSITEETLKQAATIRLGNKIKWNTTKTYGMCNGDDSFLITGFTINAADNEWEVIIRGRKSYNKDLGIGIFPRPVRLNDHPDICDDDLITADAYPEPRMRVFMAVVESDSPPESITITSSSTLRGRNLCCVREISIGKNGENSPRLWVEMASPHADANSGILARPRKGNVLVCLDRGDMSIPLALGAMWRRNEGYRELIDKTHNRTPFTQLKQMNRKERTEMDDLPDMSALTLRNRKQKVSESTDANQKKTETVEDLEVEKEDMITRPISVHKLAAQPLNFSQIQLVSRWNTVSPVQQKPEFDERYVSSALGETAAGFLTASSSSASYAGVVNTNAEQSERNRPITRPHFEGINMYSNSDLLMQSADHQLINAGGEIVLTAAQAITLRVGTSSIKLTQAGIEICTKVGTVHNPGAYPAYHRARTGDDEKREEKLTAMNYYNLEDYAQTINAKEFMPIGGRIWVDFSGVNTQGAYIANAAMNVFSASTLLGTSLTLSDFDAKLIAPETVIIGGAAFLDSFTNLMQTGMKGGADVATISSGGGSPFDGDIDTDGNKLNIQIPSGDAAEAAQWLDWIGGVIEHIGTSFSKLFNTASVTGSMVKMDPLTMDLIAPVITNYSSMEYDGITALAPFYALKARATGGNLVTAVGKGVRDMKSIAKIPFKKETWWGASMGVLGPILTAGTRVAIALLLTRPTLIATSLQNDVKSLITKFSNSLKKVKTDFSSLYSTLVTKHIAARRDNVAAQAQNANLQQGQQNVQEQDQIVDQEHQGVNADLRRAIETATAAQRSLNAALDDARAALRQNGGQQMNNPA